MFEYTALSIMAGQDGATVSGGHQQRRRLRRHGSDLNGVTLAEGESIYVTGVYVGAHVVSEPAGAGGSLHGRHRLELREPRLGAHSDDLVGRQLLHAGLDAQRQRANDGDERTTVWLYNPGSSAITVTYQRRNTSGALASSTLTVNARSTNKQILENGTAGVGSHFYATPATAADQYHGARSGSERHDTPLVRSRTRLQPERTGYCSWGWR